MRFTAKDVKDQTGKTVLITGANTGLGYEAAKVLSARGAKVLMACRSEKKANDAITRIKADVSKALLEFIHLDQSDLDSVRACAELVKKDHQLDVLINNAGIMVPPYEKTKDGFESQFGVNHLGTFAFTCLLMDKLQESKNGRVVITSSLAHKGGRIFYNDIHAEKRYSAIPRYQQSKFANLLFMFELKRRLQKKGSKTISVACHPGIATTELTRYLPKWLMRLEPVIKGALNTPEEGAWPTLMAATWDQARGGDYFGPAKRGETAGPAKIVKTTIAARNPYNAKRLWDLSVELTGCDWG